MLLPLPKAFWAQCESPRPPVPANKCIATDPVYRTAPPARHRLAPVLAPAARSTVQAHPAAVVGANTDPAHLLLPQRLALGQRIRRLAPAGVISGATTPAK